MGVDFRIRWSIQKKDILGMLEDINFYMKLVHLGETGNSIKICLNFMS